jgi:hypothetical protein
MCITSKRTRICVVLSSVVPTSVTEVSKEAQFPTRIWDFISIVSLKTHVGTREQVYLKLTARL